MEPERHEAELDDTDLLAALERAWPVPPMTGRLIARDWSGVAVAPDAASFSAPLLAPPAPRFRPGYRRQSFARIAAILALLLTSVFGVIAFNRTGDQPKHFASIPAPSPATTGCAMPLRTSAELTAIVTEIKAKLDAGTITGGFELPSISVFQLTLTNGNDQSAVTKLVNDIDQCVANGVSASVIEAMAPEAFEPFIAMQFSDPSASIASIVASEMNTAAPNGRAQSSKAYDSVDLFTADDGTQYVALPADLYGNHRAYPVRRDGSTWQVLGPVTIIGEWTSLNNVSPGPRATGCSSTSMRDDATMQQYLQNQGWLTTAVPLFAVLNPERMYGESVSAADETAIRQVIRDYRNCLASGIEPYRFAQASEEFFGIFASYSHAGPDSPVDTLGLEAPTALVPAAPAEVAGVVSLGPDKALAILVINPAWQAENKTPAIILVRQNGQWLINQLAIIEGSSSQNR
jgi:hypothetical protein